MNTLISNISIKAISSAIPQNCINLLSLAPMFGESDVKRIIDSTGIKYLRVANKGVKASDLCLASAKNLIGKLNIDLASIDAIVVVTQTPDQIMPPTSSILQHKLGLSTRVVALDINYGCSGFVYGLYVSSMLVASGGCKRVLLCVGDVITPLVNPSDRAVRMVLGDGGASALIEKGNDTLAFSIKTDGSGCKSLETITDADHQPYIHMDGAEVMQFVLRDVPFIINELLAIKGWKYDEVGVYALHQANQFMLNYLRKKMKLNKKSVPIAVENVGNTGPASIPLLLSLQHKQLRSEGMLSKSVLCGFGVGLSCAAVALNLFSTIIFDPVEI